MAYKRRTIKRSCKNRGGREETAICTGQNSECWNGENSNKNSLWQVKQTPHDIWGAKSKDKQ